MIVTERSCIPTRLITFSVECGSYNVVLNWPNKIYLFIGHIRNNTVVDYSVIVFCDMLKQVMYEI